MPNNPPLISTVIAVLNGEATLKRALDSIAAQTYRPLEVMFVDDGSTDNTFDIISRWSTKHPDIPTTILQNKHNIGLAASLNKGIKAARGQYIARIDADDEWHPEKITKQVEYLVVHPKTGVLGTWYQNTYRQHTTTIKLPTTNTAIRSTIFHRNPFGHSTVLIRKQLLDKAGAYNQTLRYGQDRDLWFRLMPISNFANLPQVLCTRSIDPMQSTTNKRQQILQTIRTSHHYIQKYHAKPTNYFYLIEPAVALLAPTWARKAYRRIT